MYLEHFGMSEKPFSLTPDTQLFFNQNCHRDALNTMLLALKEGEGFLKVVGEVGTGKTLLCRKLLSFLHQPDFITAYIPNPWISPEELRLFLASEIGAEANSHMHSHDIIAAIYRKLVQHARQGRQVILLIDEAQAMPKETIESLRLLTNLEGEKRKLIQVIIFGQPELDVLLAREDLRQLQQRIMFAEELVPLSTSAVANYISHRVRSCGGADALFSSESAWLIAKASGGIPRLINILAHKSLLCVYGRRESIVTPWHVARAIADTPETKTQGKIYSILWRYPRSFNQRAQDSVL